VEFGLFRVIRVQLLPLLHLQCNLYYGVLHWGKEHQVIFL